MCSPIAKDSARAQYVLVAANAGPEASASPDACHLLFLYSRRFSVGSLLPIILALTGRQGVSFGVFGRVI